MRVVTLCDWQVDGLQVASFNAPISNVDFCSLTSNLAVGNEHGLVRNVYPVILILSLSSLFFPIQPRAKLLIRSKFITSMAAQMREVFT